MKKGNHGMFKIIADLENALNVQIPVFTAVSIAIAGNCFLTNRPPGLGLNY